MSLDERPEARTSLSRCGLCCPSPFDYVPFSQLGLRPDKTFNYEMIRQGKDGAKEKRVSSRTGWREHLLGLGVKTQALRAEMARRQVSR